jgi:hypothetical protein
MRARQSEAVGFSRCLVFLERNGGKGTEMLYEMPQE